MNEEQIIELYQHAVKVGVPPRLAATWAVNVRYYHRFRDYFLLRIERMIKGSTTHSVGYNLRQCLSADPMGSPWLHFGTIDGTWMQLASPFEKFVSVDGGETE